MPFDVTAYAHPVAGATDRAYLRWAEPKVRRYLGVEFLLGEIGRLLNIKVGLDDL